MKNYKYTDKEIEELISSMVILIDTREQKTEHIISYFDKKKINYKKKALPSGDYSFMIPKNENLGIIRDMYFWNDIVIERKANLEEISGNLTKDRARLEKEFALSPKNKVLLIENSSYEDIAKNNYDTQYNNKAFIGTLHSFWHRYNLPVMFMPDNKYSGLFIRMHFEYWLKNYIK